MKILRHPELRHFTGEAQGRMVQRALQSSPVRWLALVPIAVVLAGMSIPLPGS